MLFSELKEGALFINQQDPIATVWIKCTTESPLYNAVKKNASSIGISLPLSASVQLFTKKEHVMSSLIGCVVRRRPKFRGGWWELITSQRNMKSDQLFTVTGNNHNDFMSLDGFDLTFNNCFDVNSFDIISTAKVEKASKKEKPAPVVKQTWALVVVDKEDNLDIQEFKSRDKLRRWKKMMNGYQYASAKTIKKETYRLEKKASGVIILTPTKS